MNHHYRHIPDTQKACVNCTHYRKNWFGFLNTYIGIGEPTHQCAYNGRHEHFDHITGKITVTITTKYCNMSRSYSGHCGQKGENWEPSEQWKNRKENLIYLLKQEIK